MFVLVPFGMLAQGHRGIGEPSLNKALMEMPAIRSTDVVLVYNGFVVNYNTERLIPNWRTTATPDGTKGTWLRQPI